MKVCYREPENFTMRPLKADLKDMASHMKRLWADRRPGVLDRKPGMDFSVLVPLIEKEGEFHILFEVRSPKLKNQPGEVCFPGGAVEAGESRREAAVREAVEELLTDESQIEVLAPLDVLITPSGQMVHPFLAVLRGYQGSFSEAEVKRVFTAPLAWFAAHEPEEHITDVVTEPREDFPFELVPGGRSYRWRKGEYRVLFYRNKEAVIWGMTAKILYSFILMCREAGIGI